MAVGPVEIDGQMHHFSPHGVKILLVNPWNKLPEGCVTRTFPAGEWAVFPYRGECPKALQDVNTRIWSEWLPNCREYELVGNYNLEVYLDKEYGEIWVPVKRKA